MKAKVNVKFNDLKSECVREIGDEYVVSKERFAEINDKIPGCLEEVPEAPKKAAKKAGKK